MEFPEECNDKYNENLLSMHITCQQSLGIAIYVSVTGLAISHLKYKKSQHKMIA